MEIKPGRPGGFSSDGWLTWSVSISVQSYRLVWQSSVCTYIYWLRYAFCPRVGQVFFIHELARVAPDSLQAMEDVQGLNLYDLEAMIAIIPFSIGWICFAASILANKVFARKGAILVIAGFFAIPLLTAALPGVWGGVLGNIVLGSGWIMLGLELNKQVVGSK